MKKWAGLVVLLTAAAVCIAAFGGGKKIKASWSGPSGSGDLQYKDSSGNVQLQMGDTLAIGASGKAVTLTAGAVTAGGLMTLTPGTTSVTNGATITATTSYMQVTPSALATCTVANASAAGQWLVIENVGTNNLVINDNGTSMALGAAVTLGTTDTLTLIANAAAQWREIATANN